LAVDDATTNGNEEESVLTAATTANTTFPTKILDAEEDSTAIVLPTANNASAASINERLNKAIANDNSEKNRSPDLVGLAADFDHMRKQLRGLIAACKKYHETSAQTDTSKTEVSRAATVVCCVRANGFLDQNARAHTTNPCHYCISLSVIGILVRFI